MFAFAQPYLPRENNPSQPDAVNQVNVYLDNSFSMDALSASGPLIEAARNKAREIAAAYRTTDMFMLTTNDFEGRHQRWVSQEEFLQLVSEVNPSPASRRISEVVSRQNESYYEKPGQTRLSYIISDFQLTMADFDQVSIDSLMDIRLVPVQAVKRDNLYIDSCWFVSPVHQLGQGVKLMVRVVNDAETRFEKVPLKLSVNGTQKALASFDIQPGTFNDIELPFTNYEAGIQNGIAEITDYPVIFDDRMFLVYDVAGSIPVLAINGREESIYLNSLFGKDSAFAFANNNYKNIDYNRLREYELIILNELEELSTGLQQELEIYLENGGNLLVIPAAQANMDQFREFLTSAGSNNFTDFYQEENRVSSLDQDNPVFSDVFEKSPESGRNLDNTDLPAVKAYYGITRQSQTSQIAIMSLLNGRPFLTRETAGNGQVYLLAVPLGEEYSNFARHALFVPALYRIALLSAATAPLYYTIGRENRVDISKVAISGDQTLKVVSTFDDYEFIPVQQRMNQRINLRISNQVRTAGHYQLMKGEEVIKGLGFNYDRSESAMGFADRNGLENLISRYGFKNIGILDDKGLPLAEAIKDMNRGTLLWKLFIILALAFLAVEIILLRFWRSMR